MLKALTKYLSFGIFKARKVSSASAIKSGWNVGRFDGNSDNRQAYSKN